MVPPFLLPARKNRATSQLRSWSKAAGSTQLEASTDKDGNKIGGVCGSWAVGSSRGDVINKCVFCGDELYPCIVAGERSVWGHVWCVSLNFLK